MNIANCPNCGGHVIAESIGWKCKNCQGFIDMQGNFHEHTDKPFMPPMSNEDRIRAMSDDELADLFYGFCSNGEHCYECPLYNKDCAGINGVEKWKEWMKQPVESPKEG